MGFAWSVPVSSKENNRAKTNGGERIMGGGGPKPFLGRGFMVCFPLPRVFQPPFVCFSLKRALQGSPCFLGGPRSFFTFRGSFSRPPPP